MNILKSAFVIGALTTGLIVPFAVSAQGMKDQANASMPMTASMPMPASMTPGVIRKVDKDNGKVTIKHGDIKHMDMPGMTMVFDVKDKAMLAPFKAGDKVNFMVVDNHGEMLITDIQPAK